MDQTALDFTITHARATDPDTSHEAARSVQDTHAKLCARILSVLVTHGPMTGEGVADILGDLTTVQVVKRLPDLHKQRLARPTDQKRANRSGRKARVWVAM